MSDERDFLETDVSGEMEEARQLAFQLACEMRDVEQGIRNWPEEDEQ